MSVTVRKAFEKASGTAITIIFVWKSCCSICGKPYWAADTEYSFCGTQEEFEDPAGEYQKQYGLVDMDDKVEYVPKGDYYSYEEENLDVTVCPICRAARGESG